MGDRARPSSLLRALRSIAVAATLLAGSPTSADGLREPWRIALFDAAARLRDDDPAVRRGAAFAVLLRRLEPMRRAPGDDAEVDAALRSAVMASTDRALRLLALAALGEGARDVTLVGVGDDPVVARAAMHAAGSVDGQLAAARADAGVMPVDDVAMLALDALADRAPEALGASAADLPLRWRVAARRGDASVVVECVVELSRALVELRGARAQAALEAVRMLRAPEAAAVVVAVARRAPERALRLAATEALVAFGDVPVSDVVALLEDPLTREAALRLVASRRERAALPAVRAALAIGDPAEREAAVACLAALAEPDLPRVVAAERAAEVRAAMEASLRPSPPRPAMPTTVDEPIAALFMAADPQARIAAAHVLARSDGARALAAITAARRIAWNAALVDGLREAERVARGDAP